MIKAKSQKLKVARIKAGLLQKEIAQKINITENAYSTMERGFRPTGVKTANKICNALDAKFDDIFEIVTEQKGVY